MNVHGACKICTANVVVTIAISLGLSLDCGLGRVYAGTRFPGRAWMKERMFLEDGDWEGLAAWTTEDTLSGKVKEKRIIVVEFVEGSTLFRSYETKPCVGGSGGEGEGERKRERDRERSMKEIVGITTIQCVHVHVHVHIYIMYVQ